MALSSHHVLKAVMAALVMTSWSNVYAEDAHQIATVTVSGHHQENVLADKYELKVQLIARNNKRNGLADKLQKKRNQIQRILDKLKIEEHQYGYTQASLTEEFQWHEGKRKLVGYSIQETWNIEVSSAEENHELIKLLGETNNIDHYESQPQASSKLVYQQALKLAVQDAKNKAMMMATELNVCLGDATQVRESSQYRPMPYMHRAKSSLMMAKSEASMPAAQVSSEATVQVTWKLKPCTP